MQNPVHLYVDAQYASPWAMSAFVALHEKGIPFEMTALDLSVGQHLVPAHAPMSLTQRIPALAHGDFRLAESSAITEYIDDTWRGTPLYPVEPKRKALARQWQAWLRSDLLPLRQERPTEVLFYGARKPELSAVGRRARDKLVSAAQAALGDGSDNLFGAWSIADVDLAVMLNRLVMHGDDMPEVLVHYAHHQWSRPSVATWCELVRPPL